MGHQETVKERGSQFWIPLPPVQTLALEPERHQRHNRKRNRAVLTTAVINSSEPHALAGLSE